jgi:hypothetical protein
MALFRNQKKHGRFFHAVSASEDVDPGDYVIRKLQLESIDYLSYKDRKYLPQGRYTAKARDKLSLSLALDNPDTRQFSWPESR